MLGEIIHESFHQENVRVSFDFFPPKRVMHTIIGTDKALATYLPINPVRRMGAQDKTICITPLTNIFMMVFYYKPKYPNGIKFE